jgi:serine/threonine protein kinase
MLVINERNLLAQLSYSPFIVNCLEASQDELHLYLLMEYMPGGDLRYLMYRFRRRFTEGQASKVHS